MKFELTRNGKLVALRIHEEGKAVRQKDVFIDGRVYVKSEAPSKESLVQTMNLQCASDSFKKIEFLSSYQRSQREKIEEETKKMMQSYMRIQNAMKCIDIAEEIEFGDES